MRHLKVFPVLRCLNCNDYPKLVNQGMVSYGVGSNSGPYVYYEAYLKCSCGQTAGGEDTQSLQKAITEAFMEWTMINSP